MRSLAVAALTALASVLSALPALGYTLEGAYLIETGVFMPTSQAVRVEQQADGNYSDFAGFDLLYEGDTATINPDHWFGFTFRFIGEPEGDPVPFFLSLTFPDGEVYTSLGEEPMGHKIWRVVRMDDSLFLPGSYVLELRTKDRSLIQRTFTLVE